MLSDGTGVLVPEMKPCSYGFPIHDYKSIENYIRGGRSSSRSAGPKGLALRVL